MKVDKAKQEICDIGKRLYEKGFAAGNDGNISCRVGAGEVICTPTLISKGFMKPEDLCMVDMEGRQIDGRRERTSEVLLHLAIMKERPEVNAVVHCHPPHATAFGVAREPVPQCVLPEVEVLIGNVPITKYAIPGSRQCADAVLPFVHKANVVIMCNHGTVSFGATVEKAYWWTEILDAYCRILMLARGLGRVTYFTEAEAGALLELKQKMGLDDPRAEMKNCEICANDVFRENWSETGVEPRAFQPPKFSASASPQASNVPDGTLPSGSTPVRPDQDALIQAIADRVIAALQGR